MAAMKQTALQATAIRLPHTKLREQRKGSIPGSRGYGLTQIFIDMPGPDAINMITVELAEAMDEYIPSLELQDIKGTQDEEGVLELDIYLGRR